MTVAQHEVDCRSTWQRLSRRERLRLWAPLHELACALYFVGVRDRLRCPSCRAVGTWKPHGSLVARWFFGDIAVRRWLCKWCGHYNGPKGRIVAYLDTTTMVWALPETGVPRQKTPAEVLQEGLGKAWPWLG